MQKTVALSITNLSIDQPRSNFQSEKRSQQKPEHVSQKNEKIK